MGIIKNARSSVSYLSFSLYHIPGEKTRTGVYRSASEAGKVEEIFDTRDASGFLCKDTKASFSFELEGEITLMTTRLQRNRRQLLDTSTQPDDTPDVFVGGRVEPTAFDLGRQ